MRMIPPVVSDRCQSDAEREVFRLLERTQLESGSTTLHSLNIPFHDYKICGELDFVVVTRHGITVLEVKGGGVSCQNGLWTFVDRQGEEHHTTEGPFEQARSGMFALRKRLSEHLGADALRGYGFGFGVCFPDIDFDTPLAEWPADLIADRRRIKASTDFGMWIKSLQAFWRERARLKGEPYPNVRESILDYLRPDFDRVPSMAHRADELEASMERLTAEQCHQLDAIESSPRILCSGSAGTGKTFLAAEAARRHAARGDSVLLTCASPALAAFLSVRLPQKGIVVSDLKSLSPDTDAVDVLILDEGQDLLNWETLPVLERLVRGGVENGRWRFFYDPNNQSGLTGHLDSDLLAILLSYGAIPAELTRNCRNTEEIVLQTRLITGADLGVAIAGRGIPVTFKFAKSREEAAALTTTHLRALFTAGVDHGEITILSPVSLQDSVARLLPSAIKSELVEFDAALARKFPVKRLTYATIEQFKGLENKFILVLDLTLEQLQRLPPSEVYVSMSRARAGLWMCFDSQLQPVVKRLSEEHLELVLATVS
jgi:hypothetical protein